MILISTEFPSKSYCELGLDAFWGYQKSADFGDFFHLGSNFYCFFMI